MIKRVIGLHFSPLGGTAKITEQIVREIAADLNDVVAGDVKFECYDMLNGVAKQPTFDDETIAVIGMPVYVGKIPLPAVKLMSHIEGNGAMTVALVSYGTASYGNALYELYNYADERGFKVIGAGAFIARHGMGTARNVSKNDMLGAAESVHLPRPDMRDLEAIRIFCEATSSKLARLNGSEIESLRIKPAPLMLAGKMPVHRISKLSPKAAAMAELAFEKTNIKRREPEWFL